MTNDSFIASFVHSKATHQRNGNLFYEGNYLYSYGKHFPLLKKYGSLYLFNPIYYSSTTQRHQAIVKKIYSGKLIHTPDCDLGNFHQYHMGLIKNLLDKLPRARNFEDRFCDLGAVVDSYLEQCEMLNCKPMVTYNGNLVEWILEQMPELKTKFVKYQLR